ncbi:MAG: HEPN domain-containing protein [Candidatus Heimdallarchaeota archaeon]|nr:MAG: HEPN domain-containing protein [Candidatus Heimdallarchaeota archaeon]
MREEVKNWWKRAERDFLSAQKNLSIEEFHLTVFLCQQSVEKGLKALYIHLKKHYFDPTQSLIYLGKEVEIPEQFLSFLRTLNPEFITTRYPDAAFGVPLDSITIEQVDSWLTIFLQNIAPIWNPERVYLFGSRAKGSQLIFSVDLLVVSKKFQKLNFREKKAALLQEWEGLVNLELIFFREIIILVFNAIKFQKVIKKPYFIELE